LYPETPKLSGLAVHPTLIAVAELADALTFAGTEGAWLSTFTETAVDVVRLPAASLARAVS
jgi:hypothetical protein